MTKIASGLAAINGLDTEKRVRILGIIDKIRELGVSEDVSLPQVCMISVSEPQTKCSLRLKLVVVGDQSSGKSSVLESLTGLSFPIASDLCTRFATQIVLRRAPASEANVRVTIIPGPSAQADEATLKRLSSFEKQVVLEKFDISEFETIFDEVC